MRIFAIIALMLMLFVPVKATAQFNPLLRPQEEPKQTESPNEKTKAESPAPEAPAQQETQPAQVEDTLEEPEPVVEPPVAEPFIEDEMQPEEKELTGPKRINIDTVVYVDYQFFDSPNAFKVKYHISMRGTANLSTSIIKGSAEIATEVTGYLAKWPGGQCILDVSIAKTPYEINYKQDGNEANINIQFKKDIPETWASTCTFIGGVTKPFKTQGPPEKWISDALEKTSPPISSIVAPLEAGEPSSTTFEISEYTVVENNVGSAKVKGTGVINIQPASAGKGEKKPAASLPGPVPQANLPITPKTPPSTPYAKRMPRQ